MTHTSIFGQNVCKCLLDARQMGLMTHGTVMLLPIFHLEYGFSIQLWCKYYAINVLRVQVKTISALKRRTST